MDQSLLLPLCRDNTRPQGTFRHDITSTVRICSLEGLYESYTKNAESGQYLLGCWLFEVATCSISFSGVILRCICSNLRMKPKAVRKIESTLNVLRLLLNLQAFVYMGITKHIDKPKESVNPLLIHYWTPNHASLFCSSRLGRRVAQ